MAIIGMPDTERKRLMDPIVVPGVLSYLIYGDIREEVIGLNDIPEDQHPPVEIVYYAYHIMVGLGTIFIAIFAISGFLLWRGRLFASRGVLWVLMLAMPFPYIANHAGWVVAEVGRQPWIVYGLRRTAEATSHNVTAGMTYLHAVRVHGAVRARRSALPAACPANRARRAGAGPRARALGAQSGPTSRPAEGAVVINTVWFIVLAFMLAGYAVLDGFDLGVGALHLLLGRDTRERGRLIDTIGPVWNGNEVWLLAAGGSMVVAFPHLYATSFSGFYLALMLVLWLLVLRGLGIEFRHQIDHDMWRQAWDVAFSLSSVLLALLFGVALGNVLRGVPLDARGEFQGTFSLMLNWFALLGGVLSVALLSMHGAAWIVVKTEGALQARAERFAGALWWAAMALLAAMIAASFVVRPDFTANFVEYPWLLLIPVITAAGAAAISTFRGGRTTGAPSPPAPC